MTIKFTHESHEWNATSPGVWERPMGENEQFIQFIGDRAHPVGREQWSVIATATFTLKRSDSILDFQALRSAWKLLRFHHPSIACRPNNEGKLTYTVPNDGVMEEWMKETFFVVQDPTTTLNDVIANLKPSPVATLHFLESRSQIVLYSAHWRVDGYGAFYLLDQLFSRLASALDTPQSPSSLPWGSEASRLVPSLEWALRLPCEASPEIVDTAKGYLATGARLMGSVGITSQAGPTTRPGGTKHIELGMTESTTRGLIDKCEAHGISLYSAVHAAVGAAVYDKASPQDSGKHYTSTIRLNLRPYLPQPYNTTAAASGLYTGGYLFAVPAGQSPLEWAKVYEAEYRGGVSEAFLQSRRQYARMALGHVRTLTGPPPPSSNVDVSFVRDVDAMVSAIYGTAGDAIEVLDLGLGVNTLTRQPYCFFWVFRGMLRLQLWFNEAFYDEAAAADVLQSIHNILVSEI